MTPASVASTSAVWEAAKELAGKYGGPRGVEKAAAADPTVLDVLSLPKAPGLPANFKDLVDIVIPTIRDLVFLEAWRHLWEGCHLIIVKDGDPKQKVAVPAGYTYEMYTRDDVERILGDKAKCISQRSAACRCFGFLVSKKKYIYTIDDDCFVCKDPKGNDVDALKGHFQNLLTPSTPLYFNTMYDPFEDDADFVACYPFSLRTGVPTAVSHGMWLNIPDYDGPTQLAIDRSEKPAEVSTRYVDAVVTIPKGVLYSNCGMNLAFDRELVGPSMYFGLMGKGTPWGRYEDMWAGWSTKIICDHLGLGVKSGKPYIWHSKASNAFANWEVEVNGIDWQETIVPFFQNLKLSESATNVVACYREITQKVREELVTLDPEYFPILADMMDMWLDAWEDCNPGHKGYEKPSLPVVS